MPSTMRTFASALVGAAAVSAHGFVESFNINGVQYSGYLVNQFPYMATPPVVAGWETTATSLGFVAPDAFASPDIVCHQDAKNALGHAQIAAGDNIYLQWDQWPESHRGPVLDYLASCGTEGCSTVDKTTLEFFKIAEGGLDAADKLIANNFGWMVKIPDDLAPGFYVLRHEIIALHSAGDANGAQAYPQCISLEVTGSGSLKPQGILATELYKPDDAGIRFNIYNGNTDYPIPGPAVIEGAEAIEQSSSTSASAGDATTGTDVSTPAPTEGNEAPQEPEEPAVTTTTDAASQPTGVVDVPSSGSEELPSSTSVEAPQVTEKPKEPIVCNGSRRKTKRSGKKASKRRSVV